MAETSASMSSPTITATDSRITSACSDAINLSTACAAVILRPSAIVWCSLKSDCENSPTIRDPRWPSSSQAAHRDLLHHFYRLDLLEEARANAAADVSSRVTHVSL